MDSKTLKGLLISGIYKTIASLKNSFKELNASYYSFSHINLVVIFADICKGMNNVAKLGINFL